MAHQIIKQPNDKYAIYSSITESLIGWGIDRQSLIEYYKEEASKKAEKDTLDILQKIDNNEKPYYQFTKTWDEVKDTLPKD
ncbi:hypothetical protein [Tenacibaculum dicentrarchi]|uniref:hypothetical protein n=1 Tax=Tenacibaculum dicentrarchi TaxID=669041 RepID=UPI003511D607